MRIARVHETSPTDNGRALLGVVQDRTVVGCGVAEFAPGVVAHEGETHVHEHDEMFIILSGEITVPIVDGPTDVARTGDWVHVEPGEEHHLTNHTDSPCTAMFLILKKGGE